MKISDVDDEAEEELPGGGSSLCSSRMLAVRKAFLITAPVLGSHGLAAHSAMMPASVVSAIVAIVAISLGLGFNVNVWLTLECSKTFMT
jgi:hypothetical protein